MTRWLPRSLRARLLLVIAALALVLVAVMTVGFNVLLRSGLARDTRTLLRGRAAAELSSVLIRNGQIVIRELPDDAAFDNQVWIYAGRRPIERPRAGGQNQLAADRLAGGRTRFLDVPDTDTKLYAVPIVHAGRRLGTLIDGVSLAPYERASHRALVGSLAFALAILLAVLALALWAITSALRPFARMTEEAADWSVHDIDHRFAVREPHDELSKLGATFNDLLGRLAASLRHEQRLSAEISHELRTPLAKLMAETDLALRRERTSEEYRDALSSVRRDAEELARILETLIVAARRPSDLMQGTSDARAVADKVATGAAAGAPVTVEGDARLGTDAELAERVLAPVIENARRHARGRVSIVIGRNDGSVTFDVADDGPGVTEEERSQLFEPGFSRDGPSGAGLGLALALRLARAVGGEIECLPSDAGGRFRIRLPAG